MPFTISIARTRLTLRYACKTAPERVAVAWGVFPENMSLGEDASGQRPPIELMARVRADGREIVVPLTRDEPEYTWHRPAGGQQCKSRRTDCRLSRRSIAWP